MRKTLAIAALAVLPCFAGDTPFEAGLLIDQLHYKSTDDTQPKPQTGFGVRFGWDFAKVGATTFQGTVGYRFQSSGGYGDGYARDEGINYQNSYVQLGAMARWHLPMDLGLGLEYRSEKLEVKDMTFYYPVGVNSYAVVNKGYSDTWGRAWVRANLGWTFVTSTPVKPFLGIDVAFPLSSKSYDPATAQVYDAPRLNAPDSQYALYGGVRF